MAKTRAKKKTGLVEVDSFGKRLGLLLDERGWSATDLVRASLASGAGGVRLPSITRALKSERSVDLPTAIRIAAALGISLDRLLDYDPDRYGENRSGTRPIRK